MIALFFKLPEAPNFWGIFQCKSCASADPYIPLVGAGYFSLLAALALLFPSFPNPRTGNCGLIWAILLAVTLTYLHLPLWCPVCLFCHACHVIMWLTWRFSAPTLLEPSSRLGERLISTLFAPVSIVALFSCLNLTLLVYDIKSPRNLMSISLKPGDVIPQFLAEMPLADSAERFIVNFVSPNCAYCKEQIPILSEIAAAIPKNLVHFINVSPELTPELVQSALDVEWMEDKEGKWRAQFKISGYPTLYVVDREGKIIKVIPGFSEHLKNDLMTLIGQSEP